MSSSPIYKLSVPLPTPWRREVFSSPAGAPPVTAAIFRAGRTLHKIRTPWRSPAAPPRRPAVPGKTLYKNCNPSPVFRAFPPYQPEPYTKTAASPAAVPFRPSDTLHKNCTLSPYFRMFFQKACFLPSIPQNCPSPLPFCPAAPAFWHRLTPPSRIRYTKIHPCDLCALSSDDGAGQKKILAFVARMRITVPFWGCYFV